MRSGARGNTHNHVKTLAVTSSRPNPKTLLAREVLAHRHATFQPCTCGLRGCAAMVASTLISYSDVRSMLGRRRGGGDPLLPLHLRVTTLDRFSDSSSATLRV
jgi:hypothetical protein